MAPVAPQPSGGQPRPPGGDRELPDSLAAMLRRAHEAERTAIGVSRTPAFRLTRGLIGGARIAGYSTRAVATALDINVDSVRARGAADGWISADDVIRLSGCSVTMIEQWESIGLLSDRRIDPAGNRTYLASQVVRALVRTR